MKITVDGRDDFPVGMSTRPLADLLYDVSGVLQGEGRAILAVLIDGNSINPDGLAAEFADKTTDDVSSLEIHSEPVLSLVEESLGDLEEVLPELPVACQGLSELFHGGESEEGIDKFHQLSEIWQAVKERQAQIFQALDLDVESIEIEGKKFSETATTLGETLAKAAQALVENDFVILSDLLQYELCPLAERELAVMKLCRQRLDVLAASDPG